MTQENSPDIMEQLKRLGITPSEELESGRRPVMQQTPTGDSVVASTVIPQLASDQRVLQKGGSDWRKLGVINEQEQVAFGHFWYRYKVGKVRYWGFQVKWNMISSISVGGLGRRQLISAQAATMGQPAEEVAERPGWVGRNLTNRSWKDKAQAEGKVVQG